MTRDELRDELSLFALGTGGIGSWLTDDDKADPEIYDRLLKIEEKPKKRNQIDHHRLKKVQLNQLLVMGHEAPVSDGFFEFYWCYKPTNHMYNIDPITLPSNLSIESIRQLKWGLNRLFIDSMLYWGNVKTGFRELRNLSFQEIKALFSKKLFDTDKITERGPYLKLETIAKDNRYLISEMACKSYDAGYGQVGLKQILLEAFKEFRKADSGSITIERLLSNEFLQTKYKARQLELKFSTDEVLDSVVNSEIEIEKEFDKIFKKFKISRELALKNTKRYLSMVSDLDVYIATSMRKRQDFRDMADKTKEIFDDPVLSDLDLRYFDPTLSAAEGHENKGIIECLMVKCAKVLVYCAGESESFGKDAEAAMALSLGKPVIFLTDQEQKALFYKSVHPLSRLIHFDTGVAVGAIVTDKLRDVPQLLSRIFKNEMEYYLEHDGSGYLRLKEKLTGSVVRIQTNDLMLNETFWNHYHAG